MTSSAHRQINSDKYNASVKSKIADIYERYFQLSGQSTEWRHILSNEDDLDELLLLDINTGALSQNIAQYMSLSMEDRAHGEDNRIAVLVNRLLDYACSRNPSQSSSIMDERRVRHAVSMINVILKTALYCCSRKLLQVMDWLTAATVAKRGGGGGGGPDDGSGSSSSANNSSSFTAGDHFFRQLIQRTRHIESRDAVTELWMTMASHDALVEYFTLVDVYDVLERWQCLNLLLLLARRCGGVYAQRLERSSSVPMWINVIDTMLDEWLVDKWRPAVVLHLSHGRNNFGSGAWNWLASWFSGDDQNDDRARDITGVEWHNNLVLVLLLWENVGMYDIWMDALVKSGTVIKWIEVLSALLLLDHDGNELVMEWALRSWMSMMESKVFRRCVYDIRNQRRSVVWKKGVQRVEQDGGGTLVRMVLEVVMDALVHWHRKATMAISSSSSLTTTSTSSSSSSIGPSTFLKDTHQSLYRLMTRATRCVHGIIAISRRYRIRLAVGDQLWQRMWCDALLPVVLDRSHLANKNISGTDRGNMQLLCASVMLVNLILLHGDDVLPERSMWEEMIEAMVKYQHSIVDSTHDHKFTGTMAKLMRNIQVVCDDVQLAVDLAIDGDSSVGDSRRQERTPGARKRLLERWRGRLDDASYIIEWPVKWPLPEEEERDERRWTAEVKHAAREWIPPIPPKMVTAQQSSSLPSDSSSEKRRHRQ